MGLPPLEIRVEILTQNLAEARARHQAKIDRYHAGAKGGRKPVPVEQAYRVTRVKAALERAIVAEAADHQRAQAAPPHTLAQPATVAEQPGASSTASTAPSEPKRKTTEPKRNITDPESRMMPLRGGGWLQGYNCQAVTSSDGLIIATSVGDNPSDATAFTEMMDMAVDAATLIDAHRPATGQHSGIGVLLADAGYLSGDNLTAPGPDRLIAVGKPDLAARRPRGPYRRAATAGRDPDRGDGAPAAHPRWACNVYAARPHRRNLVRPRQTQPRVPPFHQPRNRQGHS